MTKVPSRLKATVALVSAAALGIGGLATVQSAIASQTMVARCKVNLRTGPSLDSSVQATLEPGTTVTALASTGNWTQVSLQGRSGYVWSDYITANGGDIEREYTDLGDAGTAVTNAYVNVRANSSTGSSVIETAEPGLAVKTTGAVRGDWVEIMWDGVNRWVYGAYLTPAGVPVAPATETYGQVRTTTTVNLRLDGYYGPVVGTLPKDSLVDVTGETTEDYTQILYKGQLLWIYSNYTAPATDSAQLLAATASGISPARQAVVAYANDRVGKNYVWSGEGPGAFDDAGLTMKAYAGVGIDLPQRASSQAALGSPVLRADLKPGDLVFWGSPVSHVSVYVGNGQIVHARNTDSGVIKQSFQSYADGGAHYAGARRYLS